MLSINSNISSLMAQNNLRESTNDLQTSYQRLSSGKRINSAKDDAAGLAISDRLTAQIRGLNQAARNANDGISLGQTGEGAMQEMSSMLQRMRELAVQSANDTNSSSDRKSLNQEFQNLSDELDRIAKTTSFNGQNILDGSAGAMSFQVGANVGETISVDLSNSVEAGNIGKLFSQEMTLRNQTGENAASITANQTAGTVMEGMNTGDLTLNGTSITAATNEGNGKSAVSAASIAEAINKQASETGVEAKVAEQARTTMNISNSSVGTDYAMSMNGVEVMTAVAGEEVTQDRVVDAINAKSDQIGVRAEKTTGGEVMLQASDGRNISVSERGSGALFGSGAGSQASVYTGKLELAGKGELRIQTANNVGNESANASQLTNSAAYMFTNFDTGTVDPTDEGTLGDANILNKDETDQAIQKLDQAIDEIDSLRATFGAVQNRFESTIANLNNTSQNLSAARGRILDADIAKETAELTQNSITQQAGVSILGQANQQPQIALQLLGG
ncbi:flagellin [Thiohalorhabdus methylotrophus]|uniref:Flagellin n=1 Tax=Thiohalorhabdus methylotrophus TaxID=3242694 RepID=A0ABV4TVY1_9GAMM